MRKWLLAFLIILLIPVTAFASVSLDMVNQKVCSRFDADMVKLAAIMEELRKRKGVEDIFFYINGQDSTGGFKSIMQSA